MTFAVIGGDLRQYYLTKFLKAQGYKVNTFGVVNFNDSFNCASDTARNSDAVILPVVLTKDKTNLFAPNAHEKINLKEFLNSINNERTIFAGFEFSDYDYIINFNDSERFLLYNAMLTAEGTISLCLTNMKRSLFKSKILIIGSGRIASITQDYLKTFNCDIYLCARKDEALAKAELSGAKSIQICELKSLDEFDCVINTAPAPLLTNSLLDTANKETPIIDLAPAGSKIDKEHCKKFNINLVSAGGLPAIFSPESAAEIIYDFIIKWVKEVKL